ncbi:MAG: hypothetical protein JXR68_07720 [Bacteroidales bacterium]|nr:hypothetical protein [Bacteroidales bacterium]
MRNKILLSLAIIFIAGVAFVGCKKDEALIKTEKLSSDIQMPPLAVEDNTLYFETVEDYDALLNAWSNLSIEKVLEMQKDLGFKSMYSVYKEKGELEKLPMEDNFLALILNSDSKIIIENYLFRLDFKNKKVFSENLYSKTTEEFGFDDDIVNYLYNDKPDAKGCSQCTYVDDEYTQWTNEGDIFMEIEYNRYGIYYSLIYGWDGEGIQHFSNVTIDIYNISGDYSKCWTDELFDIKNNGIQSNFNSYTIKIYRGSTRLDQIHAYGTFKITDQGIVRYNKVMSISCH